MENFLNNIKPNSSIEIQHEPQRSKEGLGSPDFIVRSKGSIVGYIEVKKIEQNLDDTLKSDQIRKYMELSNNILLTNYIEFIWIKNKQITLREVLIFKTDLENKSLKLDQTKLNSVANILTEFFGSPNQKISSIPSLASLLARRFKTLKDLIEENLNLNIGLKSNTLVATYNILKESIYNNELGVSEFADSLAQTITYGFFISKLNNKSDSKITFNNIKEGIPNNFALLQDILRLVHDITSSNEYLTIKWILEELISIINNIDTEVIFKEFSFIKNDNNTQNDHIKDPYLYFYEDFLTQYDKNLRKSKGVYYTPQVIVKFIVESLHHILECNFGLKNGFANRQEVTVLDFATGTFLLEVVKCILKEVPVESGKQKDYITNHILQNIYGFEYLMAPYVVAHLKLFEYLKEVCNFQFESEEMKLKIFLTNTLDLTVPTDQENLKAIFPTISEENKLVSKIKNSPILVILGNPPYNSESKNNNTHIMNLMRAYKNINGEPLN
ncbi:N-6 DNA methylase [Candidatus Borreliella tachyglossi]|uniref:N-6 DNA methylase n=1 Tax=Candidatus Borreliella tachyglossi TaxID=1964448 RepID=UPI0040416016